MALRLLILLVATTLGVSQSYAGDSARTHNAAASWSRMTYDARVTWLWGAAEGQGLILEELHVDPNKALENRLPFDKADVLANVMSNLYGDPANAYIPWKYLAVVANAKLNGGAEKDISHRLELLREYAAYELKRLDSTK
jgi:hypothetical protein